MTFSYNDNGRYGVIGNMYFVCNTIKGLVFTNTYGFFRISRNGELWLLDEDGNNDLFCFKAREVDEVFDMYGHNEMYKPNFFQLNCYKKEFPNLSESMIKTLLNR